MAYSREDPYRSLGFYLWDPFLPKQLDQTETPSRRRPSWTDDPPAVPSPNPDNPFGDPPRFHNVNPPEQNPYNDPAYNPNWLVTEPFGTGKGRCRRRAVGPAAGSNAARRASVGDRFRSQSSRHAARDYADPTQVIFASAQTGSNNSEEWFNVTGRHRPRDWCLLLSKRLLKGSGQADVKSNRLDPSRKIVSGELRRFCDLEKHLPAS